MEDKTEVRDWTGSGKESFTTPGGPVRYPAGEGGRVYGFTRADDARFSAAPRPAARTGAVSPFSREAGSAPAAQAVPGAQAAAAQAAAPRAQAGQTVGPRNGPVVLSHDGESQAYVIQPQSAPGYGPQIYTIQLPAAPRREPPRRQSLWWVPLLVVAALLLGLLGGLVLAPMLGGTPSPAPTQAAPSGEADAARIYRENVDAVVHILAIAPDDPMGGGSHTASAGTGFLITADGFILTNAHVVENSASIQVTLHDGRKLEARLAAADHRTSDLALLKVEASGLPTVTLGSSADLRVGDAVYAIGNPLGEVSFSLTTGALSAGPRQIDAAGVTLNMLQTNAAFNQGNSGGPLFNARGEVVGIVTAKLSGTEPDSAALEGLGFALPIDDVRDTVNAWLAGT